MVLQPTTLLKKILTQVSEYFEIFQNFFVEQLRVNAYVEYLLGIKSGKLSIFLEFSGDQTL